MISIEKQLPFEKYLESKALGSGAFVALNRSAKTFKILTETGKEPTDALRFGSLAHMAILEPEKFKRNLVVEPKFDRRTKLGKLEYAEFVSLLPKDALIVSEEQAGDLIGMIDSIKSNPKASDLLRRGDPEVSVFTKLDDVDVRARFDFLVEDVSPTGKRQGIYIVDLKTTQDASRIAFNKSLLRYKYWIQAGLYTQIAEQAFDCPVIFVFLAIEKKPPYECGLYVADDSVIDCGKAAVKRGLKLYKECLEKNEWPGFGQSFQNLSMPDSIMNEYAYAEGDE